MLFQKKLISACKWLAFLQFSLNTTKTCRESQTLKLCSYWNMMLSEIFMSVPFEKTECSTYAKTMTIKSSQFHGSRRKVNSPTQKPLARIFIRDSKVYIPVKVYLDTRIHWNIKYEKNTAPCQSIYIIFFPNQPKRCLLQCDC